MRLSVIIPVFNEKNTLENILQRVKAVPIDKEIIIVDDCSTDGSREIIKSINDPHIKTVFHTINQGKGAALKSGFAAASADYIIIQDADLEYNPNDFIKLLKVASENDANTAIYGSRFKGKPHFKSFAHFIGNWSLTMLTNLLYRSRLTDMETCYKLIPTKTIQQINLKSKRFDVEPEITAKLLKRGVKIIEVPIDYQARGFEEGKKISWKDGFAAVLTLLKYIFTE